METNPNSKDDQMEIDNNEAINNNEFETKVTISDKVIHIKTIEELKNILINLENALFIERDLINILIKIIDYSIINDHIQFFLCDDLKKLKEDSNPPNNSILSKFSLKIENELKECKGQIVKLFDIKISIFFSRNFQRNVVDEAKFFKNICNELSVISIIYSKVKNLEIINFSHLNLNQSSFIILNVFMFCDNLKKIKFSNNRLEDKAPYALFQVLENCPKLISIDFSSNNLKSICLEIITKKLTRKKKLKKIDFSNNPNLLETKEGTQYFCTLISITNPVKINISNTGIADNVSILNEQLEKMHSSNSLNSKKLYLHSNNISTFNKSIMDKLYDIIRSDKCPFEHLTLSNNDLNYGSNKMLESFLINKSLKKVDLTNTSLKSENFEILKKLFSNQNSSIESLRLNENNFDFSEVNQLLLTISNKNLRRIDLSKKLSNDLILFQEELFLKTIKFIKENQGNYDKSLEKAVKKPLIIIIRNIFDKRQIQKRIITNEDESIILKI